MRPGSLIRIVILSLVATAYRFAVTGGMISGSELVDAASSLGPAYFVALWVSEDARRSRSMLAFHYLLWVWVLWPIFVPHYVLASRGRRGIGLAIGLWTLLFLPVVGMYAGWSLYYDLPDLR